jgi:hypothetical protein
VEETLRDELAPPVEGLLNRFFEEHQGENTRRASNPRPPAPIFGGKQIETWLSQFRNYARICGVPLHLMVDTAALCLGEKPADQWAMMSKQLVAKGQDPQSWDVFERCMRAQYIDLSVESTVRSNLATLSQKTSVAGYHAAFRALAVQAVTHPLSGPEACYAFRRGLKPAILRLVLLDPLIRDEMEDVDKIVQFAKTAELTLNHLDSGGEFKKVGNKRDRPSPDSSALSSKRSKGKESDKMSERPGQDVRAPRPALAI